MAAAKETPQDTDDDVLKSIHLLSQDVKAGFESFKKKAAAGLSPTDLVSELNELYSMQADAVALMFQAHYEHFGWAGEVDSDLDDIKAQLEADGSTILPEDAVKLKSTILALVQHLREPTSSTDTVLDVKKLADEAIAFIDESTAEIEEDDETDDEDEATETP
jgi:hypothetical protein